MRNSVIKLHAATGIIGLMIVLSFFSATLVAELLGTEQQVVYVKQFIFYSIWLLIPVMAATGLSGFKFSAATDSSGKSSKRRRMKLIAANALLILIPSAVFLKTAAVNGDFGTIFYLVQAAELAAGGVNLFLLILNARDGIRLVRQNTFPARSMD